jgi:TonB family protein
MKWCWLLAMIVTIGSTLTFAHSPSASREAPPHCNPDLLDPTNSLESVGVPSSWEFGPYRRTMLGRIRMNWVTFIPREARFPQQKTACVAIEFYILKEGNIERMKLGYTSGDEELDQAAWQAIKISSPFEPLPPGLYPPALVRINFLYNPEAYKLSPKLVDSLDTLIATQARALSAGPPPSRSYGPLPTVQTQIFPLGGEVPSAIYSPTPSSGIPAGAAPVNGEVLLSLIVTKRGDARHVKVTQHLTRELDENARSAIATWKFQPAYRYGKPVDMPLGVKVSFNLK